MAVETAREALLDAVRVEIQRLGEQLRDDVRSELHSTRERLRSEETAGTRRSSCPNVHAGPAGAFQPPLSPLLQPTVARNTTTPRQSDGFAASRMTDGSSAPRRGPHQWSMRHIRRFSVSECEQELAEIQGSADERPQASQRYPACRSTGITSQRLPTSRNPSKTSSLSMEPTSDGDAPRESALRQAAAKPGRQTDGCSTRFHLPGATMDVDGTDDWNDGTGSQRGWGSNACSMPRGSTPSDAFAETERGTRISADWQNAASYEVGAAQMRGSMRGSMRNAPHFRARSTHKEGIHHFTKKAMGLSNMSKVGTMMFGHQVTSSLEKLVCSILFERIMMVFIAVNCVTIGTQVDYMISYELSNAPMFYRVTDMLFCLLFIVEVSLRMYVHRLRFFSMWGWGWNVMDLVIIVMQIAEEGLKMLIDNDAPSLVVLRILRIFRSIRILRIFRVMRFAEDLRLLVTCIIFSMRSFIWALAFMFLMIYIYGIYLTQSVHLYRIEHVSEPDDAGSKELMTWYGSISRASLSLFQALTGGVDWNDIVLPLMTYMDPVWGAMTVFWIAFSTLAILNIITCTFVQNAIEQSSSEKERNRVTRARNLFSCLTVDGDGCIARDELQKHLDSPDVREFFRIIDVATSEAECVFDLLDCSGSGFIDFEEFLSGCIRLQGQARALDMILLVLNTRQAFDQQEAMMAGIESKLAEVAESVKSLQCQPSRPESLRKDVQCRAGAPRPVPLS